MSSAEEEEKEKLLFNLKETEICLKEHRLAAAFDNKKNSGVQDGATVVIHRSGIKELKNTDFMRATETIRLTWVALKIRVTCENRTEILHHKESRIR